jgi:SET domain-containing protein
MSETFIQGRINFKIRTGKSRIHGKGAFAAEAIPARRKIGALAGHLISKKLARKKAAALKAVSIVELWNGMALDATCNSNELKFINHSCRPNTFMRNIGNQVEFYALKSIRPEEELTCNYGETHHEGTRVCHCGAPGCKGFL